MAGTTTRAGSNGRLITREDLQAAYSQVMGEGEATARAAAPRGLAVARRAATLFDAVKALEDIFLERVRDVEIQYASLRAATRTAIERYSDTDLALIRDYLQRTLDAGRTVTTLLNEAPTGAGRDSSSVAPLGATTSGRLVFVSGAPFVTLRAESNLASLYRARVSGSPQAAGLESRPAACGPCP